MEPATINDKYQQSKRECIHLEKKKKTTTNQTIAGIKRTRVTVKGEKEGGGQHLPGQENSEIQSTVRQDCFTREMGQNKPVTQETWFCETVRAE